MKRILFLTIAVSILIVLCSGKAVFAERGPDPFDRAALEIVKPDASLPQKVLDFFGDNGKWKGESKAPVSDRGYTFNRSFALIIKSILPEETKKAVVFMDLDGTSFDNLIATFSTKEDGSLQLIVRSPKWTVTYRVVETKSGKELEGHTGSLNPTLKPVK